MTTYKILVGSYTDAIYTLEFDPAPSAGPPTLKYLTKVTVGDNPSWIEAHPSDRSLIFAGLEQAPDGQIVVVKYDKDGNGKKIEEATCSSGGADPCTLFVTEDELLIGNVSQVYRSRCARLVSLLFSFFLQHCPTLAATGDQQYSGGTLATVPISTRPPYTRPAELWKFAFPFEAGKPGRNPSRQEVAHPHQTVFNPLNATEKELLVPDLGSDRVWQLVKGSDGHWAIRSFIGAETGGGPRHIAFHGT